MKKASIHIPFNEEKLLAVKMYTSKKDMDLELELLEYLERLYEKHVPQNVRDFIAERYEG